ncbi:MAG: DUF1572 family protein [Candidatus Methylacidiphilales bacterium]
MNELYLVSVKKQFLYYKNLGEKAFEQIEDNQLFIQDNDDTNSIATIVKHMAGNMLSRWTDIFNTDGEKPWRMRDEEFENDLDTKENMLITWNKGWDCFFETLNNLETSDLEKIIFIRNEGHTVIDAINRQLAHYSYHVGQIVFYSKQLKPSTWNSLSIPKNKSNEYNTKKFALEKSIKHFTDNELK